MFESRAVTVKLKLVPAVAELGTLENEKPPKFEAENIIVQFVVTAPVEYVLAAEKFVPLQPPAGQVPVTVEEVV